MGNGLNSLQFLRIEAEETGALSEEGLALFDSVMQSLAGELQLIGDKKDVAFTSEAGGMEILPVDEDQERSRSET